MNELERLDGRSANELRNLQIEVGVLHRADGSARVILGKNEVIAAVNGPRELHPKHMALSQKAIVQVTYKMLPFSVEYRKHPIPSRREKEISKVLSEAFESIILTKLFPRSTIDIQVQMIQSDGGSRTAAAIATSAALADAGIPMRGLIGGIASGLYQDHCVLDLSGIEDNEGTGDCPILYSPALDEVSLLQLDGKFTLDQFKTCFNMSIDAIKKIDEVQRAALVKKYDVIRQSILGEEPLEEDDEKAALLTVNQDVTDADVESPTQSEEPEQSSEDMTETDVTVEESQIDEVKEETVDIPKETTPVEEASTDSSSESQASEDTVVKGETSINKESLIAETLDKISKDESPKPSFDEKYNEIDEALKEANDLVTKINKHTTEPEETADKTQSSEEEDRDQFDESSVKSVTELLYEKRKNEQVKDKEKPKSGFFSSKMQELLQNNKLSTGDLNIDVTKEESTKEDEKKREVERDLEYMEYEE